jgi:MFS family permease
MSLYAAENIDDAYAATRAFLRPFSPGRWAKLALVVFFAGAGSTAPTVNADVPTPAMSPSDTGADVDIGVTALPDDAVLIAALVVAAGLLVGLVWGLIGSVMDLVLVESLRSHEVTLRRYWGLRWRQGLRLFGFRLAVAVSSLALFGGWLALVIVPVVTDGTMPDWWLPVLLVGIPLAVVGGLLVAVLYQFTTMFVVPVMVRTNSGVLAAWRRFWPSLRAEWKEFAVYALVNAALTGLLGVAVSIALAIAAIVVLVPLGLFLAVTVLVTASGSGAAVLAVLGVLALVFVVTMAVVWAFVQVPVVTYLRYYALLVLGDVDPSLDLVPRQRADIRSERRRR